VLLMRSDFFSSVGVVVGGFSVGWDRCLCLFLSLYCKKWVFCDGISLVVWGKRWDVTCYC